MDQPHQITYRKRSFLSQVALGLSCIAVTVTVCGAAIVLYGMHIASTKAADFLTLAGSALEGLPDFQNSLPPLAADLLRDRRQPDYRSELEITARVVTLPTPQGTGRLGIEILNKGDELVSFMSLRVVALDRRGDPVFMSTEWAATPIAADEWPGPLMPGSRRRLSAAFIPRYGILQPDEVRVEVEVTDIRVWEKAEEDAPATPARTQEI
jgi:hypothetical protein